MMILSKFLDCKKENIYKEGYIWNAISGLINAFQSVLILIVLAHTCGPFYAGIFSLAYSVANLLLNIGHYNLRNFQVTDSTGKYSFQNYFSTRIITFGLMTVATLLYVVYGRVVINYSDEKTLIVLFICLIKGMDCIEDVFWGEYQKEGRIDIAAKCMSIRLFLITFLYCIILLISRNLLLTSVLVLLIGYPTMIFLIAFSKRYFPNLKVKFILSNIGTLIKEGFGLFISAFLAFYTINASKYAIDIYLSQEMQAYYAYLSMPVFVIALFSNFIYQPILPGLAKEWAEKAFKKVKKRIVQQFWLIVLSSCLIILLGIFIGIHILSFMYHTDLTIYKIEFLLLLIAGSIYAYIGFVTIVLTLMRKQKLVSVIYIFVAIVTFFMANLFVSKWGMLGGVVQYVFAMLIEAVLLSILMIFTFKKAERRMNIG